MPLFLGDIVQTTVVGRCYSQRILLSLMWRVSQAGPPEESVNVQLGQLFDAIKVGGTHDKMTAYLDCLQTDYQMLGLRNQVVRPVRTAYRFDESVHLGTGGAGTVANDSAALTLRTAVAGRNQVATKHIGPIADGSSLDGRLTLAFRAKVATLGALLTQEVQIAVGGLTFTPVIFHRSTNTFNVIETYVVGEQSRVQRRRTVGLGE